MELKVMSHMDNKLLTLVNGTFGGIITQFLADLSLATQFLYTISSSTEDTDLLRQNSTADFFGAFASSLISGESDLACCTYYYVLQRAKVATLLLPITTEKFRGFYVQPGLDHKLSGIFYAPFGLTAAIVTYSITFICVIFTSCIYWNTRTRSKDPRGLLDSFLKGSWWVLVAYSLKNYNVPSKPTSLQILAITTSFFFYIMNSTYSAFLLSTLTSTLNPVKTFDDLLTFGYSIYANPSLTGIIQNPKYAKHYTETNGSLSSFKLAAGGGHVHVDNSDAFAYFGHLLDLPKSEICGKLSVVPFAVGMSSGIYLKPNASLQLRETLNKGIARMGDVGLLHKFNLAYHSPTLSCPRKPRKHIEMGMNYVGNLFEVFGGMGVCSFIVFLVELITTRRVSCIKSISHSRKAPKLYVPVD